MKWLMPLWLLAVVGVSVLIYNDHPQTAHASPYIPPEGQIEAVRAASEGQDVKACTLYKQMLVKGTHVDAGSASILEKSCLKTR